MLSVGMTGEVWVGSGLGLVLEGFTASRDRSPRRAQPGPCWGSVAHPCFVSGEGQSWTWTAPGDSRAGPLPSALWALLVSPHFWRCARRCSESPHVCSGVRLGIDKCSHNVSRISTSVCATITKSEVEMLIYVNLILSEFILVTSNCHFAF